MEIKFGGLSPEKIKADLLTLPVKEKGIEEPVIRLLDRLLKGRLSEQIRKSKFTGAEGTTLIHPTAGRIPASHVLLLGMGKGREIEIDSWRKAGARAKKEAGRVGGEEIAFFLFPDRRPEATVGAIVEGTLLASYQFDKYRSESYPSSNLRAITLVRPGLKGSAAMDRSARQAVDLVPGVFLARDLVNEPPSVTTARYLGEQAKRHCRGRGLSVEVWGKKKIQAMNLAGLLAVNRGSV
ncbi:MAG: M17 family peptidase N-terminal domain-containing protein, partial [Candidatus Binatia bacterium]